ncbi:hypothetical protein K438DRAFT_1845321, partial [Mycena galopus ATCC 62051]
MTPLQYTTYGCVNFRAVMRDVRDRDSSRRNNWNISIASHWSWRWCRRRRQPHHRGLGVSNWLRRRILHRRLLLPEQNRLRRDASDRLLAVAGVPRDPNRRRLPLSPAIIVVNGLMAGVVAAFSVSMRRARGLARRARGRDERRLEFRRVVARIVHPVHDTPLLLRFVARGTRVRRRDARGGERSDCLVIVVAAFRVAPHGSCGFRGGVFYTGSRVGSAGSVCVGLWPCHWNRWLKRWLLPHLRLWGIVLHEKIRQEVLDSGSL